MQFNQIKALVLEDFQATQALIHRSLKSDVSLINDISGYLLENPGKQIRPLILLLTARACGYPGGTHPFSLAAAIEFIHTATLLHDDVVDGSPQRRGKKTANQLWGNEAAVLVGDYLYSKAFQLLMQVQNFSILEVLSKATTAMAEGEALQLIERNNPHLTEAHCLRIIHCKTAKLFEASAHLAALICPIAPSLQSALAQYGLHLGTAFQLMDDVLDYEPLLEGKTPGNDLKEGKVTFPLIQLFQKGTPSEVQWVQAIIREGHTDSLKEVQALLKKTGALAYTKAYARQEAAKAQEALQNLTPSPYQEALHALADFAIQRNH